MPRHPREFAAGVYHLAAHGSSNRRLFLDDTDRHTFLDLLDLTWTKNGLELISYVLMTNHYHVVTWIPDNRLSAAIQVLHGRYSLRHNSRHGSSAHLFRAHCFARRIDSDDDLLTTEHYLAHNPVGAGIALEPTHWPWSSTRAHAGLDAPAISLTEQRLRGVFGEHANWRRRYAAFIAARASA